MIKDGILNPALANLLCRFRHTNTIVICDQGFPFWKDVETIDLSLANNIPTVLQVLQAIVPHLDITAAHMAENFVEENSAEVVGAFQAALAPAPLSFEAHVDLKKRVPGSIAVIRTGDTTQYANVVLESGRPD